MGAGIARRKAYDTPYMEVTEDNLDEVAEWCGGVVEEDGGFVWVPTCHGQVKAWPGHYVMSGRVDFWPIAQEQFAAGYELVLKPGAASVPLAEDRAAR